MTRRYGSAWTRLPRSARSTCRGCSPTRQARAILITGVVHGVSQLEERYGEAGAKTVWNCCGTKVILGGISDADTLEDISRLCGTIVIGEPTSTAVRIVPPELLRPCRTSTP